MKKNLAKLVKKVITDKRGKKTTVWVRVGKDIKKPTSKMKAVNYGKFGTGSVALRAHSSASYIQGTGYKGVTFGELKSYLNRQLNETITKEKMYAVSRMLFKHGYGIKDAQDWTESKIYESKKYVN